MDIRKDMDTIMALTITAKVIMGGMAIRIKQRGIIQKIKSLGKR